MNRAENIKLASDSFFNVVYDIVKEINIRFAVNLCVKRGYVVSRAVVMNDKVMSTDYFGISGNDFCNRINSFLDGSFPPRV